MWLFSSLRLQTAALADKALALQQSVIQFQYDKMILG